MSAPFTASFRRAMRPHIAGLRADGLTWQAIGRATGLCAETARVWHAGLAPPAPLFATVTRVQANGEARVVRAG